MKRNIPWFIIGLSIGIAALSIHYNMNEKKPEGDRFHRYRDEWIQVIEMVKSEELKPSSDGTVILPEEYQNIADSEQIYIRNTGDPKGRDIVIFAQYDHWFPSDAEFLAYSSLDSYEQVSKICYPVSYIYRIEQNWFIFR